MKLIVEITILLLLLSSCFSTNEIFIPPISHPNKVEQEVSMYSTLPKNIGITYRSSFPVLGSKKFDISCFGRFESTIFPNILELDFSDYDDLKSQNYKLMIMPVFRINESKNIGLGFSFFEAFNTSVSFSSGRAFIPKTGLLTFLLSYSKVTLKNEYKTNYWTYTIAYTESLFGGYKFNSYTNSDNGEISTSVIDVTNPFSSKSIRFSKTFEKRKENKKNSVFSRFEFGLSIGSGTNFMNNSEPKADRKITKGRIVFSIPITYSYGIIF